MATRRVLVTGAGSGIGRATLQALRDCGHQVVGTDLHADSGAATAAPPLIIGDVSNETDVASIFAAAVAELGGLDVVIHCAGIMREQRRDIREVPLASWHEVIEVNLTGSFLVAREAARMMVPAGGGALILVGSIGGTYVPSGSIPYGASKGGVNGLALTLAEHLAPYGIRVNNFTPGTVDTPLVHHMLDEALRNGTAPAEVSGRRAQLTETERIGKVLAFLASEQGDIVVGSLRTT